MPPNELEGILVAGVSVDQIYFGHLFLRGVQHLRAIVSLSGFEVRRRMWTDLTLSSVLLGVIFYPLLLLATAFAVITASPEAAGCRARCSRQIWREQVLMNLSPTTLLLPARVLGDAEGGGRCASGASRLLGLGIGLGPHRQAR